METLFENDYIKIIEQKGGIEFCRLSYKIKKTILLNFNGDTSSLEVEIVKKTFKNNTVNSIKSVCSLEELANFIINSK